MIPLRRTDIAGMAIENEDDPELFLAEVEARGVGVLPVPRPGSARTITTLDLPGTIDAQGSCPRFVIDTGSTVVPSALDHHVLARLGTVDLRSRLVGL